jgi:hypothetical protein
MGIAFPKRLWNIFPPMQKKKTGRVNRPAKGSFRNFLNLTSGIDAVPHTAPEAPIQTGL